MYLLGMWSIGIFNLVVLIGALASRQAVYIIGVMIFVPVFSVAELVVLRIICEVCVVILLLPYYVLKGGNRRARREDEVEHMDDVESQGDGLDASVHRNRRSGNSGSGNNSNSSSSDITGTSTNPMTGYTNLAV